MAPLGSPLQATAPALLANVPRLDHSSRSSSDRRSELADAHKLTLTVRLGTGVRDRSRVAGAGVYLVRADDGYTTLLESDVPLSRTTGIKPFLRARRMCVSLCRVGARGTPVERAEAGASVAMSTPAC
jgi:hypothetical protein